MDAEILSVGEVVEGKGGIDCVCLPLNIECLVDWLFRELQRKTRLRGDLDCRFQREAGELIALNHIIDHTQTLIALANWQVVAETFNESSHPAATHIGGTRKNNVTSRGGGRPCPPQRRSIINGALW